MQQAEEGIDELREAVNTLITIPNQRLLGMVERSTPMTEAFEKANNVLLQACKGIADLITTPGLINLDFADVRTVMRDMGGQGAHGQVVRARAKIAPSSLRKTPSTVRCSKKEPSRVPEACSSTSPVAKISRSSR